MKRTPTRKEDDIRVEYVLRDERSMDISGGCPELRHELAVALAAAVATGGRWLKFRCRPGRVLYVTTERTPDEVDAELEGLVRGDAELLRRVRERVLVVGSLHRSGDELVELVMRTCARYEETPPALVVIDEAKHPASRFARRSLYGRLHALARTLGAAVAVVRRGVPAEDRDVFNANASIVCGLDDVLLARVVTMRGELIKPFPIRRRGEEAPFGR